MHTFSRLWTEQIIIHDEIKFLLSDTDVSGARVLIPSLTVTLLVFSVVTFLTGLLLGCVLLRYNIKRKTSTAATATPPPVYEEILARSIPSGAQGHVNIINNEAYGPITLKN